jgi:uncharacterized protein YqgV (UPF0045/DUF77 family)
MVAMHEQQDLLFTFTILPLGAGDDISLPVSETVAALEDSDLNYQVTGSCTLIEGKWPVVMPVIENALHELSRKYPRVYANIAVDYHRGREGRLTRSVERVEEQLGQALRRSPS